MKQARVKLTVLGSSSAIPRPGRACSSYLIQVDESSLALDFGTGAFANLLNYCSVADLGAIIISHLHADHFLDIIPMRYALRYGPVRRENPLPVYIPPGSRWKIEQLAAMLSGEPDNFFSGVIDLHEYDPDVVMKIAGVSMHFARTQHYIDAYAMSLEWSGVKIAYSGDTAQDERVVRLALGADYFICEATLGAEGEEHGKRGHCSAHDAGMMAQAAGVHCLALTHYGIEHAPAELMTSAASVYEGQIEVLDDHAGRVIARRWYFKPRRFSSCDEEHTKDS